MLPETSSQSRAKVKWTVKMDTDEGTVDGVIININKNGAFIRCQRPLRLSETCKLSIDSPDHPIQDISAEVVWTNIHGPDDELTPRGMGVRFEEIDEKERKFLRKLVSGNGESEDVPVVELSDTIH
ncbi:MAG: PilZ domain-containing protein [Syntrophobacterales bacterium]